MRRSKSSNPTPLGSSRGVSALSGRFGCGFDGFPDFVSGDLGTVGKALAFDALEDGAGALNVIHAELLTVVPTEIELVGVALKMLLANAVECTNQAALQKGE